MFKKLMRHMMSLIMILIVSINVNTSYAAEYPVPKRAIYYTSPVMVGEDVKYIQSGLKKLGYNIAVDGSFGPGARDVTKKFQKDNGLTQDGSFGPATLKKLQEKLGVKTTPATIYKQDSVVGNIKNSNAYKEKEYKSFFTKVNFSENKNFVIPGLKTNMVPQGMCDIGNYILISAYDKSGSKNSCIHVINKSTGKLVKTVYISDSKSHVGGLAYDGTYVWVANGTKYNVTRINAKTITNSNTKDGSYVKGTNYSVKSVSGKSVTASFSTYSNGILWVGIFDKDSSTYVYGYKMENSALKVKYRIEIPNKIQGMAFLKDGKIALSQSYGRNNTSKILVYNKPSYSYKNGVGYATLGKEVTSLNAPPATQNMFVGDDNLLYVLFESAANYYYLGAGNNKAKTPVDRVCPINIR